MPAHCPVMTGEELSIATQTARQWPVWSFPSCGMAKHTQRHNTASDPATIEAPALQTRLAQHEACCRCYMVQPQSGCPGVKGANKAHHTRGITTQQTSNKQHSDNLKKQLQLERYMWPTVIPHPTYHLTCTLKSLEPSHPTPNLPAGSAL